MRPPGTLTAAALVCFLLGSAGAAHAQFGRLGDVMRKKEKVEKTAKTLSELDINTEQEVAMGREVAARMIAYYRVYDNQKWADYVRKVGAAVALQSERQDLAYHFELLDLPVVNAFAAPGGYIFVTRGLLENMSSEAELAGVLAHEVGHVAGRHVVNALKTAKGIQVGSDLSAEFRPGSPFLENVAREILLKLIDSGLSQADENDADRRGVLYSYAAGYRPDGLKSALMTLQKISAGTPDKTTWLTRTHPPLPDRIRHVEQVIAQNKMEAEGRAVLAERYQAAIKQP